MVGELVRGTLRVSQVGALGSGLGAAKTLVLVLLLRGCLIESLAVGSNGDELVLGLHLVANRQLPPLTCTCMASMHAVMEAPCSTIMPMHMHGPRQFPSERAVSPP